MQHFRTALLASVGALALLTAAPDSAAAQPKSNCYLGAGVGAGMGVASVTSLDLGSQGVVGGGEIGCDAIFNPFFVGVFLRGDGANVSGNVGPGSSFNIDSMMSVDARAGFFITKQTSAYGIVGYSWAHESGSGLTSSANFNGVELGGGMEHYFQPQWSAKIDYTIDLYNHQSIGLRTLEIPASVGPDVQRVMFHIDYHFGQDQATAAVNSVYTPPLK